MVTVSDPRAASLLQYVELFLAEVESRGRTLDAKECDLLGEIVVRLAGGNYNCADLTRRFELLLATDISRKQPTPVRADPDLPTLREFRSLLELVRSGR